MRVRHAQLRVAEAEHVAARAAERDQRTVEGVVNKLVGVIERIDKGKVRW